MKSCLHRLTCLSAVLFSMVVFACAAPSYNNGITQQDPLTVGKGILFVLILAAVLTLLGYLIKWIIQFFKRKK